MAESALDLIGPDALRPFFNGEAGEVLSWLVPRLVLRGKQAAVESDLDTSGRRTILSWLDQDLYTFGQKYQTLAAAVGKAGEMKDLDIVGEQLIRLRYRCRSILNEGMDPTTENGRYTCKIPVVRDEQNIPVCKAAFQMDLAHSHANGQKLTAEEARFRFNLCGKVMLEVATWLCRGEFTQAGESGKTLT